MPIQPARAGTYACPSRVQEPAQCLKPYRAWNPRQHNLQAVAKQLQSNRAGRTAPCARPALETRFNAHNIMQKQPSQVLGAEYSSSRCRRVRSARRVPLPSCPCPMRSLSYLSLQNLHTTSPASRAHPPTLSGARGRGARAPGSRRKAARHPALHLKFLTWAAGGSSRRRGSVQCHAASLGPCALGAYEKVVLSSRRATTQGSTLANPQAPNPGRL